MSWRYQAFHQTIPTVGGGTEDFFEVRRVYDHDDGSRYVTYHAVGASGATKAELIADLERMLRDVREYPVLEDEEYAT